MPDGQPLADSLSWARERLTRFDPLADGPAKVFEDLVERNSPITSRAECPASMAPNGRSLPLDNTAVQH